MSSGKFPVRFGKYILLDRINSGGMAEVFRAKMTGHGDFQRLLAIKCMLPNLVDDAQFITMFVDEAKLASQLSHANIVQIYELGSLSERLYIAMELVNGQNLRGILKQAKKKGKTIPPSVAAYIVSRAAAGLDFAHRQTAIDGTPLNLVHRDVSPQNILVSYDGEVKVVDFGIAKAEARATETKAGVLKGKFAYMAPEQVRGEKYDRRADIFSLGVVFYELITHQKLFKGKGDLAVLEKVRALEIPDLDEALQHAAPEVKATLEQTLTKTPENRFAWADEMAESLMPMLIEGNRIVGASRARAFMQELFEDEVAEFQSKLQHYAAVTEADCLGKYDDIGSSSTRVFKSAFADAKTFITAPGDSRIAGTKSQVDPVIAPLAVPDDSALHTHTHGQIEIGGSHDDGEDVTFTSGLGEAPTLQMGEDSATMAQPQAFLSNSATEVELHPAAKHGEGGDPRSRRWLWASAGAALLAILVVVLGQSGSVEQGADPLPAIALEAAKATEEAAELEPEIEAPTPVPDPVEEVPVEAPARPAPDSSRPSNPPPKAKSSKMGFLRIGNRVGTSAKIFVDGRMVGWTPLLSHQLSAGTHRVWLQRPSGDKSSTQRVVVKSGDGRSPKTVWFETKHWPK